MKYHGGIDNPPNVVHDYYRDTRHAYGTRAYFAERRSRVSGWDIAAGVVIIMLVAAIAWVKWFGR